MTETTTRTAEMRQWAVVYIRKNRRPIPIPQGRKNPNLNGWQNLEITEEDVPDWWSNGQNIGLRVGEPSGNLADVDKDRPEAVAVGEYILKDTKTSGGEGQEHGASQTHETHETHHYGEAEEESKYESRAGGRRLTEEEARQVQQLISEGMKPRLARASVIGEEGVV